MQCEFVYVHCVWCFMLVQEYLQALHDHYEDWLGNEKHHSWHGNTPVLVCIVHVYQSMLHPQTLVKQDLAIYVWTIPYTNLLYKRSAV